MRRPTDRAEIVVRTWIVPTIATAFKETYPELDVADVLGRCVTALTERLREEFREERQQLVEEIPHSIAVAHRDAIPADQGP